MVMVKGVMMDLIFLYIFVIPYSLFIIIAPLTSSGRFLIPCTSYIPDTHFCIELIPHAVDQINKICNKEGYTLRTFQPQRPLSPQLVKAFKVE